MNIRLFEAVRRRKTDQTHSDHINSAVVATMGLFYLNRRTTESVLRLTVLSSGGGEM